MRNDFWISLKRSIHCKPNPSDVHEPEATIQQRIPQKNSNSKDCFPGTSNNMLSEKPRSGNLIKSSRSSDILNPIAHKVVLDISQCCPRSLSKGVRGPHESRRPTTTPSKKTHHVDCNECNLSSSNSRVLMQTDCNNNNPSTLICLKCGEKLKFVDAIEAHHVSQHSVIELDEEDSTRQIIETICRTSRTTSQTKSGQIKSVLKVQNSPRTFARFDEYREMIKNSAEKSDKKQPRCLVDGNELLRFHGTTLTCSMGTTNGSSSSGLCTSQHCCVCQILRHGSFITKEFRGSFGVLTTSTCDKAFESIRSLDSESDVGSSQRKSVMVCRVIAGRILYDSVEENEEGEISGFDSLAAEKRNGDSEIEELYVLDPRAILPCFVVIYKPYVEIELRKN